MKKINVRREGERNSFRVSATTGAQASGENTHSWRGLAMLRAASLCRVKPRWSCHHWRPEGCRGRRRSHRRCREERSTSTSAALLNRWLSLSAWFCMVPRCMSLLLPGNIGRGWPSAAVGAAAELFVVMVEVSWLWWQRTAFHKEFPIIYYGFIYPKNISFSTKPEL